MVILQSHIYFFMNLPTFVFGIGILSHIFFGHIRPLYVALWSITGSTLSLATFVRYMSLYGQSLAQLSLWPYQLMEKLVFS
ncbi:hypothetical protein BVJ53_09750 [Lacticaseibacillus chiayiensis]|uniref:Uncharacterized protein n=1 Tax=Lacticaseibacillus chiayiensis TaxID=2100821 RepID=A0A4Q1TQ95_9LACO|nr:hypothetical protein [Lacticaseibacillus chiayiensis]RXT20864.1 hypothetical protein BVJ53_09750 [Lacticaseibacillus chiayiensis]